MLELLRQALRLIDSRDVLRVCQLLTLSIVTAIIELLGIGSIAPFIAVLSNPELVDTNPYLSLVYVRLGFDSPHTFLTLLAGISVALASLRVVLFMFYQWLSTAARRGVRDGRSRRRSRALRRGRQWCRYPQLPKLLKGAFRITERVAVR